MLVKFASISPHRDEKNETTGQFHLINSLQIFRVHHDDNSLEDPKEEKQASQVGQNLGRAFPSPSRRATAMMTSPLETETSKTNMEHKNGCLEYDVFLGNPISKCYISFREGIFLFKK